MQHPGLVEVARRDPRYAYEAYEFIFSALEHTQKTLGRGCAEPTREEERIERHVSGAELVRGACDLARNEYGRMARVVFHLWGIDRTGDFGEIVFSLIDASLLHKTDSDSKEDFCDLFDLDAALTDGFEIRLEEKD